MELRRVVITGLGAVTPVGNDVPTTWNNLLQGKSGATDITLIDTALFKTHFACEVKNFDLSNLIDKKELRKMDRYTQFALQASNEAMTDAAFNLEAENKTRMGVIWASGMGGLRTLENELYDFDKGDGTPRFNPFLIPKVVTNMAAGNISIMFGLQGPSFCTTSACASSTHALINAFDMIRIGRADVMIAGGSEAAITVTGVGGFNALRALSTRNEDPQTASRPFSASRDGFVLGEGAACLILEDYEHAKARGAKIYAEMIGGGMTSDAHHLTAPEPEGIGASRVMEDALKDAHLQPKDVDHINTHGTSTPLGDIAELKAIQHVFGEHAYNINLNSTKSMMGHMLGATGAIEALATVLAIKNDIVPPTINHQEDDKDENIDYRLNFTFNKAQKRVINVAMSNTFGFGGHNATVVFKKI